MFDSSILLCNHPRTAANVKYIKKRVDGCCCRHFADAGRGLRLLAAPAHAGDQSGRPGAVGRPAGRHLPLVRQNVRHPLQADRGDVRRQPLLAGPDADALLRRHRRQDQSVKYNFRKKKTSPPLLPFRPRKKIENSYQYAHNIAPRLRPADEIRSRTPNAVSVSGGSLRRAFYDDSTEF